MSSVTGAIEFLSLAMYACYTNWTENTFPYLEHNLFCNTLIRVLLSQMLVFVWRWIMITLSLWSYCNHLDNGFLLFCYHFYYLFHSLGYWSEMESCQHILLQVFR